MKLIFALIILSNMCLAKNSDLPILGKVEDFYLTNSKNVPFSYKDNLEGKVWLAFFFYTTCKDECPRLVSQVKKFSQKWTKLDFVGFSVDPKRDNPNKLSQYEKEQKIEQLLNWHLLTGEKEKVLSIIEKQFLVPTKLKIHTQKVILIDKDGLIRGYYSLGGDTRELEHFLESSK